MISGGGGDTLERNQGLPPVGDQPGHQVHILRVVQETLHCQVWPASLRSLCLHTGLSRHGYSHGLHLSSPDGSGLQLSAVLTITSSLYVQAQARHGNHSGGIAEIGSEIIYQNGVLGLFRGLQSKLLQSVTAAGFMFMSYENIFQLVNTLMGLQAAAATKSVKTS